MSHAPGAIRVVFCERGFGPRNRARVSAPRLTEPSRFHREPPCFSIFQMLFIFLILFLIWPGIVLCRRRTHIFAVPLHESRSREYVF